MSNAVQLSINQRRLLAKIAQNPDGVRISGRSDHAASKALHRRAMAMVFRGRWKATDAGRELVEMYPESFSQKESGIGKITRERDEAISERDDAIALLLRWCDEPWRAICLDGITREFVAQIRASSAPAPKVSE